MAGEPSGGGGNIEVSQWLKSMPVAPEYHPTMAEFQDPIAYIFKIEKEASKYGICKIVPPVPAAPKKTIVANFNKSLLARGNDSGPTFTTRQQQIGFCPRKHRPVQRSVWQSGERYTLVEFEAKAKNFERGYLKKYERKALNALEMETLYWNAAVDKPFDVEYANDMPGSAFVVRKKGGGKRSHGGSVTVGETEWNMRSVSRTSSSLLKFMREEIPGVTSPMVYVAMMFSWFAWHVEDHDLHSLNYLHMGAGKTWYGVPREAAVAFEEVIREHGYGGEINPLVTFATLGQKTTVMSPEVLINAGVPCCRLVQNAGEFVVTFPRAYHSGFSHGFNCGEASNIATPEWLRIAKEAAVRRASINCPPMVSHFQLLYDQAVSLCSRVPSSILMEPRSSRLKDKKKGEGEMLIKELFCQDMMQNNNMLTILCKGSSVVLPPQNSLRSTIFSKSRALFPSLCSPDLEFNTTGHKDTGEFMLSRKQELNKKFSSLYSKDVPTLASHTEDMDSEMKKIPQSEQGLFSCVTCGILCFACVAIIQPTAATACYLMSADCSVFRDWKVDEDDSYCISDANASTMDASSVLLPKKKGDGLVDVSRCASGQVRTLDNGSVSGGEAHKGPSSLGLLALNYGNSSDSEEDGAEADNPICGTPQSDCLEDGHASDSSNSKIDCENEASQQKSNCCTEFSSFDCLDMIHTNSCTLVDSNSLTNRFRHQMKARRDTTNCTNISLKTEATTSTGLMGSFSSNSDEDSSRLHVFCLQHAIQAEKWLNSVGGAHVFLVCHPDYPKIESQAKKIAEDLEIDCMWSEISFREAAEEDEEMMHLALDSENAIHGNGDWTVKMGINLFYSANLSRSPLYSKQMPYNFVIYTAFGRSSHTDNLARNSDLEVSGRQKKIVVAGKWCGKVWMSSQAHPLLVNKDFEIDLKRERPSEGAETVLTVCRSGRKRKTRAANRVSINRVSVEAISLDGENIDDDSSDFTLAMFGRKYKGKMKKSLECENLDESSEELPLGSSRKQIKNIPGAKRSKKETLEFENLDDGSSEEFPLCNSWKPTKSGRRTKQVKRENSEADNFEGFPEEFPLTKKKIKNKGRTTKKEKDIIPDPQKIRQKSKKQLKRQAEDGSDDWPSTRLRKRATKECKDSNPRSDKAKPVSRKQQKDTKAKKTPSMRVLATKAKVEDEEAEYPCDIEGCTMSFDSKHDLTLHKQNICPVKNCGKKFFSHKYLVQHRRVHVDDRPLKCPWKGCKMTFKWAWARTEHIRVHTGARPYVCTEAGCGQTFRFVSDFSRHKRKTGHILKKARAECSRIGKFYATQECCSRCSPCFIPSKGGKCTGRHPVHHRISQQNQSLGR